MSIQDGRRFEVIYESGEEPEDEPDGSPPERVDVRQTGATEGYSTDQDPPWDESGRNRRVFRTSLKPGPSIRPTGTKL